MTDSASSKSPASFRVAPFVCGGMPEDETARLAALRNLDLLDSAPAASFDRITRLVADVLALPIVLVSLVDENRQWFKSKVGLDATETPRDVSFCAHAVFHRVPLVVPDARADERFAGNPLVTGAPFVRAYAGIPLFSRDGYAIGTLCAIDVKVRGFDEDAIRQLTDCARVVEELVQAQELAKRTNKVLGFATGQTALLKQKVVELERSEQRFQCLVRLTSQLIWTNSPEGRMEGEQPGWSAFTGQSAAEYRGFGWANAVHPEDAQPTVDEWNRCVTERRPFLFEHRVKRFDGVYRTFSVDAAPVCNEDGTIREWVGVHHDITERRRQEQEIRAKEANFRFLAESVPQMVWTARPDGVADYYNPQWFTYTGMTPQQLASGDWGPIHADDIRDSMGHWERSVASGEPYQVEHRFRRVSDGTYRWHLCRAVRLDDENGVPIKWFGTCTDIHDYKQAEARNLALQVELEDRVTQRTVELQASQEFLDRAGRIAGVGGWSVDIETQDIEWSDRTCLIHEVERGHKPTFAEATGYYLPGSREILQRALAESMVTGKNFDLELTLMTAKGRSIWVRSAGEVEMHDGKAMRMFGAVQDITARKATEADLARQHELIRVTLESIGDAVITTDDRGFVQWLNPVAAKLTGWQVQEARGCAVDEVFRVVHEATREAAVSPVTRALAPAGPQALPDNMLLLSRHGIEYGIQESVAPIRDDDGRSLGMVLVFHDVSEQRRLAKDVSYRASHDALTGLVNRPEFEIRLKRALATATSSEGGHALLFIDLDQFKLVNDACGHAIGDQLLRQVSAIFQNIVRSRDTLARLGGDEFAVILENCSVAQAGRVANQLCESMENFRFTHEGQRFRVGASVGLVPIDGRWFDTTTLMQAADASCYAAKEGGRNRVYEWVDTDERLKERQWETQWVTRLEEALDENKFVLFAQRIVPCDGRADGLSLEILLRLTKADGTFIAPSAFLPAAERFHMASRIDRWVVSTMLNWMGTHSLQGVATISINLSGQSIGDRSFHRFVTERVAAATFDLHKLCFEITETAAITNMGDAAEFIDAMRKFGIKIALDDFGAGASSFGYLKSLRVDILKIDGQFVRDLLHDRLDYTAVCCFRDVAAVSGLKTVAEFVETADVLAELKKIGIHYAQGFLMHRPEPLENLFDERGMPAVMPAPRRTARPRRQSLR